MPRVQRNQHQKRQRLILMRSIAVVSSKKLSEAAAETATATVTRTARENGGDASNLETQKNALGPPHQEMSPALVMTSALQACMMPA